MGSYTFKKVSHASVRTEMGFCTDTNRLVLQLKKRTERIPRFSEPSSLQIRCRKPIMPWLRILSPPTKPP